MKRIMWSFFCCFIFISSLYAETISYGDGEKYVGEVSDGLPHGQGTYTLSSGVKIIGEFKDGLEWNAIKYNVDGSVTGEWIEGVRQVNALGCVHKFYRENGKDKIDCQFQDGKRYVGEYIETPSAFEWNSQGTFTWPDGQKYIGEWKDSLFHGRGTYLVADTEYFGEFENDRAEGKGIFTFADGSKYAGEFSNNSFHGLGVVMWSDGSGYAGAFNNGASEGLGIGSYDDGTKFVGEFRNGEWWTGTYYGSDGSVMYTYLNGE